ncbi:major facilitator superfamily domain-containing protein [Zychaea mexicana]|uniref:major facilitator superfamily domain-containing protein n=1 Tax=Zychaea mexicana TaxID=64656 RepID=UPI0022FE55FA|nr:major facilitator superfamily domain-containing protein [Zychaea mexicana]KAI9499208.1 major facilitator superfamily domain-containing protein [Zychaea mexicana]
MLSDINTAFSQRKCRQDCEEEDTGSCTQTVVDVDPPPLKTYPQAWMVLFFLVLLRTAVAVFQFTFSVVPNLTAEFFSVSLTGVNWLANVQCLVYVVLSFFTGWLFERLGVKRSLILAGFLCAAGSAIRFISSKLRSFPLVMVGQVIGSAASPLSLNIMTMVASTWFTESMRATAGMFVASNYGAILGMFMIPATTSQLEQIPMTLLIVTVIAVVAFVPLVFMPAKPPTPPSFVQNQDRPSFFAGLKLLARNYNFWILFVIHSLNVGLSIAFGTIFTQMISPYGYSDTDAGQLNAIAFFAGTLGCSVAGPVLDKTKQHKLFLKLIAPMVLVSDVGLIFIIRKDSYAAILFVMAINQFFLSFLVPVVIELGSETSYPVSEATTSSILWQGAQVFGFILVVVMDAVRDPRGNPPNNLYKALIIQAGLAGAIMILAFLFMGRMGRSEAIAWQKEQQERSKEKSFEKPSTTLSNLSLGIAGHQGDSEKKDVFQEEISRKL